MRQKKTYGAIDSFRLAAALLIVAIHTGPLESFSPTADFLVTYCFGRIAVPFFLMVTGFFVLAPYQRAVSRSQAGQRPGQSAAGRILGRWKAGRVVERGARGRQEAGRAVEAVQGRKGDASWKVWKFLRKATLLYAAATVLYFPIKIYSKQLGGSLGIWLKEIFFDGTFYHLWYLPAVILGCLLLLGLLECCRPPMISAITLVLYLIGVMGDSYYGLISQSHILKAVYEGIFAISSYTRNGIFFAPIFLWMGVIVANGKISITRQTACIGFLASLAGMLGEGLLSYSLKWQKHNSMYLLLLPVMFFLFVWLLSLEGETFALARDCSMCIYIIHPLCIILVRGAASVMKMTDIFVDQSFIHYLSVCGLSVALSLLIASGIRLIKEKRR